MRVGKIKNGKPAGKDEITGEMIKRGGDSVVDWIWKLCNMTFESGVVHLYKGEREMTECKNYRGFGLLSVVEKIYEGILVPCPLGCSIYISMEKLRR